MADYQLAQLKKSKEKLDKKLGAIKRSKKVERHKMAAFNDAMKAQEILDELSK